MPFVCSGDCRPCVAVKSILNYVRLKERITIFKQNFLKILLAGNYAATTAAAPSVKTLQLSLKEIDHDRRTYNNCVNFNLKVPPQEGREGRNRNGLSPLAIRKKYSFTPFKRSFLLQLMGLAHKHA